MRVDVCVQFTTKNKKLFVNATFLLALCARPYPLPLGRMHCALVLRIRMALGHLGHLGHRFKLTPAQPCGRMLWVIWVIVFCVTQMT